MDYGRSRLPFHIRGFVCIWHRSAANGNKPPTCLFTCCWHWHHTMQSARGTHLRLWKLEEEFLIVSLKRALITTCQGQFACSVLQNQNEAPINYAHYPGNWLLCGQTCPLSRQRRRHQVTPDAFIWNGNVKQKHNLQPFRTCSLPTGSH